MEAGKRRSQRDYTLTFKLSVVDQVEKGELSYKEAQERYGIQGKNDRSDVVTQAWSARLEPRHIHWLAEDGVYAR